MPQIWPMNWVTLFFYFLVVFLIFMVLVYFVVNIPSLSVSKKVAQKQSLSWTW
uniref:ATP synthase complex subunit 8 n=1 Tax=Bosmina fatalis TaxID=200852 RepID=A0A8E7IW35_9CRUS|nr:ATP synthase F0 subunit 8 [Bosmina fatalis]